MAKGDHIYVYRGIIYHHGIDCGDGTVIHYSGKAKYGKICRVSKAEFAKGEKIYIKDNYPKYYSPSEIVKRAKKRLNERDYNVVFNNCEHFVYDCTTGESDSPQLNNAITGASGGVAAYMGLSSLTTQVAAPGLLGFLGGTVSAPLLPIAAVIGGGIAAFGIIKGTLDEANNYEDYENYDDEYYEDYDDEYYEDY